MSSACESGFLAVAQWLFSVGAPVDPATRDGHGETMLLSACKSNHLDVCKWLLSVGDPTHLRVRNNFGMSPMFRCCKRGYLGLAKWLCAEGAAEDLTLPDNNGYTPLCVATNGRHLHVAQWLLAEGAANDEKPSGHVNTAIVQDEVKMALMEPLRELLLALLEEHRVFCEVVMLATNRGTTRTHGAEEPPPPPALQAARGEPALKRPNAPAAGHPAESPFSRLRGHEESLLQLIAEFVGVPLGRRLRNVREAAECLREDDFSDEDDDDTPFFCPMIALPPPALSRNT